MQTRTHLEISGHCAKGLAFVGNIRIDWTRTGAEKRMAASPSFSEGSRVHHCSNIIAPDSPRATEQAENKNTEQGQQCGGRGRGRGDHRRNAESSCREARVEMTSSPDTEHGVYDAARSIT